MKPDPEFNWLERLHQGRLDAADVKRWREAATGRPQEGDLLEEELALESLLSELPRPEVGSNFTARVLAEIERGSPRPQKTHPFAFLHRFRWVPQIGVAGMALALALGWWQWRGHSRSQLARDVASVARTARAAGFSELPPVEALRDFDAIELSRAMPRPDDVAVLRLLSQ
jgi:hypothetical protein